ncbi:hypothetical protein [Catellatospora citrea]|uniref:Uncharacterized protein n=1 Tax=Catellatospora citrea TaxID=53366 RepID=A0A8J3KGU7_9ACTN|nr:hypothetical protein [Catellatospora citrea]GIG00440.1 hypothetical protein Cci01nite_55330 [Catellatospora citrea]
MSRRPKPASAALIAAAMFFVASCDREPDHLPDIASDMAKIHDILLNHVEEHGGPAQTFGPFSSFTSMTMFTACLGGGKVMLSTAEGTRVWGSCNGHRIGGAEFDSGSGRSHCITMTVEGEVTAWEVVVTKSRLFSDRPAPDFFTAPTPEPATCATS